MKKVVLYTRISTDEDKQVFSLNHQNSVLEKFCEIQNIQALKIYREECSAKTFNRPQYIEMLKFVKANRKEIDAVVFTKWDRFARNLEGALRQIRELKEMGVSVYAVEQALDLSNPDNKAMLALYLVMPEIENDKISSRTKDGLRRAMLEGFWVSKAPYGYEVYDIDKKRHSIRPIEPKASLVLEAFDEVSKGVDSVDSIRVKMNNKGLKLTKQSFYNMLRNVAYIGKIKVKAYKKDDEVVVVGAHRGIISESVFKRVQLYLSGRKRGDTIPSHRNTNFPLRNFLQCGECGENLTASQSTGRSGEKFGYYHCRKACKVRVPVDSAHSNFIFLLQSLTVHESVTLTLAEILKDNFGSNEFHRKQKKKQLIERLESVKEMIAATEDRFIAKDISKERFEEIVSRYEEQKLDLNYQIEELESKAENPINYFAMAQTVLTGLDKLYVSLDYDLKRALIGSIFPEKIQISKDECRTTSTNEVVRYLTHNIKELEGPKKKKATKNGGLSTLALPAGLEPATL